MKNDDFSRSETAAKIGLLLVSVVTIGFLAAAALRETVLSEWYQLRQGYSEILQSKAVDERGRAAADQFEVRIVQNYLPQLGTADRCTTCHAGVEDPRMAEEEQPYTSHPGKYLEFHDPEKFGCSVCHQGQGRATETLDAHGRASFWDYPMLEGPLVRATCTKCHEEGDLYGKGGLFEKADSSPASPATASGEGAATISRGRKLFNNSGCMGCHARQDKGGKLGPDLSRVGDKTAHQFSFKHLETHGERSTVTWLTEHFMDPQTVSPGSLMPAVASEQDAKDLTAYSLSLRGKQNAYAYRSAGEAEEIPGGQLYLSYCSACHGADGKSTGLKGINTPALNNPDTLAVAADDYYRLIIENGRSGSLMPSWGTGHGNLSRDEIDRIVGFVRGWQGPGALISDISSRTGVARRGRAYYNGLCAGCHGLRGEGGIGTALSSPTFQSIADDGFLARTIVYGRPGTAMPAWKQLKAGAINDILAYIRSWSPFPASFDAVNADLVAFAGSTKLLAENRRVGKLLYGRYCSTCHGSNLEGRIGPSLGSNEFLAEVDDEYLFRAVTEGRPGTAMPAWRRFSAADVSALIVYLRSFEDAASRYASPVSVPAGDWEVGRVRYEVSCQRCHGEQGVGSVGPQLANPVFLSSVSDQALYKWIAHGRAGTAMKGFLVEEQGPTQLKPEHIGDIIAYLRHLQGRNDVGIARTGAGNARIGEDLYAGTCVACHGRKGEGASGPQLNNKTFLENVSDGFLAATIVLGRTGTAMHPMVHGVVEGLGQLDPKNVEDVVAYIRQWESSPEWKVERRIEEVSDWSIEAGRDAFSRYCAGCHGTNGRGGLDGEGYHAPALNNQEFLDAASDGFLLATIARGRAGTPMRPFGRGGGGIVSLDGDEIGNIVAYVRTWQK